MLHFYDFAGSVADLTKDICEKLNSLGANASYSGGTSTTSSENIYCINDEAGNEFCIQLLKNVSNTGATVRGFVNCENGYYNFGSSFYQIFGMPQCSYKVKQDLEISKLLLCGANSLDITSMDLYTANGMVAPNVIYTDKVGNKYTGLNQFMLMKNKE